MDNATIIREYWAVVVACISYLVITILYYANAIDAGIGITVILLTNLSLMIVDSIRNSQFRHRIIEEFAVLSEAKVIPGTSEFFRDLLKAVYDQSTKRIDFCYFTQRPPTAFYHINHVKKYWKEMPAFLNKNPNKSLRRIVMVGSKEMVDWLNQHVTEHNNILNYSLSVIVDKNLENSFINLCLTDNYECYLFSPHASSAQPSYVWIKNYDIYKSFVVSYERMWALASPVIIDGMLRHENLISINRQF